MKTLPAVNQAEDAAETLALVCDALGIGELARSRSTILMNVENARRRSDCLWKIEHEFFMVSEPDEDEPDGPPFETCLLNWGDDPDQYVKKFGEVLAGGRVPVALGAEPELRRILREVIAVAITQLVEAYPADTVAEFSVEELQLVSDASRVLRAEQVEHIYRRGFDLTLAVIPSGGAGGAQPNQVTVLKAMLAEGLPVDSLVSHIDAAENQIDRLRAGGAGSSGNGGLDSASIRALIEKYGSQAHPDEVNEFTTGDLPLVKAVIAAMHGGDPVDFTTLGAVKQQQFPPRILSLLREVADRKGTATRAPWEDESGERMQNDADAAIAWIEAQTKQPDSGHLSPSASGGK